MQSRSCVKLNFCRLAYALSSHVCIIADTAVLLLRCRLGEGGFGVVFKATMHGCDEIAVKYLKDSTRAQQADHNGFLKEVQVRYG